MKVLRYVNLATDKVKKQFSKTLAYLEAGDFKSADVKKMPNTDLYRAKLDATNRLLFKIGSFEGEKYLLLLEVILNHAYDKSRFLQGAVIDESKLIPVKSAAELEDKETLPVTYLNPARPTFHLLDKPLSFDEIQAGVLELLPPLIIIGSAGSGKTALTLEKIKTLKGRVLYVTLSAFLAENSQSLYYSSGYENSDQEVEFLSFYEYISTIQVPQGREITFKVFDQWVWRYKQAYRIQDTYKVFEEFKGVLTGSVIDKPYLPKEDYLQLGVKQSIFAQQQRESLYELFTKYLDFLAEGRYFDSNIVSWHYLNRVEPRYDFVVVDEVQDITLVQLALIRKALLEPRAFILCGDSNQIVHPNFFSWSQIKSAFYQEELSGNIIRILATNYRNTPEVTAIANKLLLVKNARFGSIDKESTYLVQPNSRQQGNIEFFENKPKIRETLNQRTKRSARIAVLVMRNEDKAEAAKYFDTPLLFSVQEAKGLEYESIILFDIISSYQKEFRELTVGVSPDELKGEIRYARARDKSDKSLDEYKFYVNSLYVAITRAVRNLYVIETNKKHELLALLELTHFQEQVNLKEEQSSQDEWQREASRLEKQGKQEQAEAIRKKVLKLQPVPWEIITRDKLLQLKQDALNPGHFNKKAKDRLFEYSLFYGEVGNFPLLANLNYKRAERWEQEQSSLERKHFAEYAQDKLKALLPKLEKWGLDYRNEFNLTPFMLAVSYGADEITQYLLENGAKTEVRDNYGRSPLQIALNKSYLDERYKNKVVNRFYPQLSQESLRVKVEGRLVKLDSHQAEYLMLQYMIAVLRPHIQLGLTGSFIDRSYPSFQSADFIAFFEGLSLQVVPEYRRKRPYISSILSKNEVSRDDKYNKMLFLRTRTGHYIPNPSMELAVEDEWVNLYELINIEELKGFAFILNTYIFNIIEDYRAHYVERTGASR
jgi:hypothetical protein